MAATRHLELSPAPRLEVGADRDAPDSAGRPGGRQKSEKLQSLPLLRRQVLAAAAAARPWPGPETVVNQTEAETKVSRPGSYDSGASLSAASGLERYRSKWDRAAPAVQASCWQPGVRRGRPYWIAATTASSRGGRENITSPVIRLRCSPRLSSTAGPSSSFLGAEPGAGPSGLLTLFSSSSRSCLVGVLSCVRSSLGGSEARQAARSPQSWVRHVPARQRAAIARGLRQRETGKARAHGPGCGKTFRHGKLAEPSAYGISDGSVTRALRR